MAKVSVERLRRKNPKPNRRQCSSSGSSTAQNYFLPEPRGLPAYRVTRWQRLLTAEVGRLK